MYRKLNRELYLLMRSTRSPANGKLLKLFGADVVDSDKEYSAQECGIITNITKNTFDITTGAGVLRVNEVQLEGKKRMDAASFLRGCRLTEGTALKNSR